MAKFGENIVEFKNIPSFNRIPVTCTTDNWYVNTGKNSVTKVQDSKSIHVWTLLQGHIHYFTTPVAHFEGKLYSVMDETILLKWSNEDTNLENAENVKLPEDVHSIIHLPESEPLVVFQSGKFLIIDTSTFCDPKPHEGVKLKSGDCLEWVDAVVSPTEINIFFSIFNNKNKRKTFHFFSVNKEYEITSPHCKFDAFPESTTIKAYCLNHQELSFFYLLSDGTLHCCDVRNKSDKVMLTLEDICADTLVDICCIDAKHFVGVKYKPNSTECLLEIWDTKQAILRGSRKIKTSELISLQMSATSDYIFLNFVSDKLIAIPYHVDSSFVSTLNTSKPKEFQQLLWNTNMEVKQIPVEVEPMDISVSDQSSSTSVELLAEKLLNQDSSDLKFISESELIKILQLLIRHKEKDFSNDMYNLLNMTFSTSFNDALLLKHLKCLNIEDILVTLDILLNYLKNSTIIPVDVLEKPSDLQIVNWICLVISSNTETLLFTKDKTVKKLLKDLKKTLSTKMKEFEDLEGLQSYLSVLQKKDILPQEISVEKYCIETLNI